MAKKLLELTEAKTEPTPLVDADGVVSLPADFVPQTIEFIAALRKQLALLAEPTPPEIIQYREGRGKPEDAPKRFSRHAMKVVNGKAYWGYVPHQWITAKLQQVLAGLWWYEIVSQGNGDLYILTDEQSPNGKKYKSVSVFVNLCIDVYDGQKVVHTLKYLGVGVQDISGITLGNAIIGAVSRGIRNAASRLGLARDISWDEEAVIEQYEAEQERIEQAEQKLKQIKGGNKPTPAPAIDFDKFNAYVASGATPKTLVELVGVARWVGVQMPELLSATGASDIKSVDLNAAFEYVKQKAKGQP